MKNQDQTSGQASKTLNDIQSLKNQSSIGLKEIIQDFKIDYPVYIVE